MKVKHELTYLLRVYILIWQLSVATFDPRSDDTADFHKNLPAQVVWAVLGRDVDLPCDVTPPTPRDRVAMVLWFKGSTGIPLYSLDRRGGPTENETHWAMTDNLGARSFFVQGKDSSKAHLHISNVEMSDAGIFRCRVDFMSSPTRNFRVNLTLVVQPSEPKIFDAQGREVVGMAGPFLEGYDLFLSCQVSGGKPHPSVAWYRDDVILDGVVDTSDDAYTTVNQLVINKVSRSMHKAQLQCRAQSSYNSPPITREVLVSVFLKPEYVKLIIPTKLLSVQHDHAIRCETSGSYPPAEIAWYLDGETLKNATSIKSQFGNMTSSILNLKVAISDDGKEIVCKAYNPRLPEGFQEDHKTLNVAYPPAVYVVAGPGIDSSSLHEGSEVNLSCEAHANPPPHAYSWYHGLQLLEYNEEAGIFPDHKTLTLKNLRRQLAGEYRCAALNTEGETRSVPFKLKILYAPYCREGHEVRQIAAVRHDTLVAHCEVDAAPPFVKFSWTYNSSLGDVLPVQGSRVTSSGLVSQLHFTPLAGGDFGTLACWASNSIGNQAVPCYFHILPAKPPNPPEDCRLHHTNDNGIEVSCVPGEDGGMRQHFALEVVEETATVEQNLDRAVNDQATDLIPSTPTLYRLSGHEPLFHLHSLEPGREYKLLIYAINPKGRSEPPVILDKIKVHVFLRKGEDADVSPFKNNNNLEHIPDEREQTQIMIFAGIAICAGILVILTIVVVLAIFSCRKKEPRQNRSNKSGGTVELGVVRRRERSVDDGGFGESLHRQSDRFSRSASIDQGVPLSRRISQHIAIDHPDLILH